MSVSIIYNGKYLIENYQDVNTVHDSEETIIKWAYARNNHLSLSIATLPEYITTDGMALHLYVDRKPEPSDHIIWTKKNAPVE